MITLGGASYRFDDPRVLGALFGLFVLIVLFWLLVATLRRTGAAARSAEMLAAQMGGMNARVQMLSDGQQQLFGGLTHVTEAQATQQQKTLQLMEHRLAAVTEAMNVNLSASARNTALSLGELQQRLQVIDKAQDNIRGGSGNLNSRD